MLGLRLFHRVSLSLSVYFSLGLGLLLSSLSARAGLPSSPIENSPGVRRSQDGYFVAFELGSRDSGRRIMGRIAQSGLAKVRVVDSQRGVFEVTGLSKVELTLAFPRARISSVN